MSYIAIIAVSVLIAVGLLVALLAGIRNVIDGRSDIKKVTIMAVPAIVLGGSYAALGTLEQAGVATMIVMIALMALGIVVSSIKRTFNL